MLRRRVRRSPALLVVVGAALAAVVLGGCGKSSSDATPTARVPDRTTTTVSSTTTAAPGQEDFTAILRDLLARRDEAYEKNDVSILESIYSTQCECLANGRKAIEQQLADGVHAEGARLRLLRTEVVSRLSPENVIVRGVVEQPAFNFVDTAGNVVRAGNSHGPLAAIYELSLRHSTWVILGITTEGPVNR